MSPGKRLVVEKETRERELPTRDAKDRVPRERRGEQMPTLKVDADLRSSTTATSERSGDAEEMSGARSGIRPSSASNASAIRKN